MNAEYWDGEAGEVWASVSVRTDPLLEPFGFAAMDRLGLAPGERVLDVGCGAGATTRALAARVGPTGRVLGVDVSRPLLAKARSLGGADYHHADAGADPVPGPFDALFSRFGVMFFADPVVAFGNLRGAMRPGGRLGFVCWGPAAENAWARDAVEAALPFLREPPPAPPPDAPGPFAFGDPGRVRRILEGSGWTGVSIDPLGIPYRLGSTPEDAADLSLVLGPLARLVREHGLDPAPIRTALVNRLRTYEGPEGVLAPASCWVVSARA